MMADGKSLESESSRPSVTDDDDQSTPKTYTQSSKRISFPADSILNAVIQDGDVIDLLFILKNHGSEIDINQTNHSGLTALHHAVLANNLDMAKLLLNHGADVHIQDVHGLSPLHTAAALGLLQMTSYLILFGADVFCHTKKSELPIDLAKDVSVIRLLYHEMAFQIQKELYFRFIIKLYLGKLFRLLCNVLLWMLKVIFVIITTMYYKCLYLCNYHRSRNEINTVRGRDADPPIVTATESQVITSRCADTSGAGRDELDKKKV